MALMADFSIRRRDLLALGATPWLASSHADGANAPRGVTEQSGRPADRRHELYALLGKLPERHRPIKAEKLSEAERDGYILESWRFDLNGLEPVPAIVARPRNATGKMPAVLFNHSHGGGYTIGKKELLEGRDYLQKPPYAKPLTDAGYVVLCIDHWVFGERSHTTEADTFKAMLWQGQVLWGMMVYDSLRAMDYLVSRPDVDASRVGTLGMSMGSTMAFWLAALDERVKVTVDICCLTDFHTLLSQKGLSGHGVYYYVPGLLKHFTTSQINALIAPRAHLGLAGLKDKLTPVEGLDIIDRELTRVYTEQKHPERWKLLRYDVGHMETAEGRQEIIAFLNRFL
jgi:acetyl esterase/lipase